MQAQMEMNLEMMLTIESHSSPSRENEVWLKKFARINKEIKTECRRILISPDWMTWRRAQIEIDVEIEIPTAVANADNTTVLKLLNYYGDDYQTQARMVGKIQDIFDHRYTSTNLSSLVGDIERTQIMFHTTPDSNGVHFVPSNIMQVACHILSSVKASDLLHTKAYSSVFDYVVEGYDSQLRMHDRKRSCIAWRAIFVNVFTNILCQILKGDVLEDMPSRKWSDYLADSAISNLRHSMQCVMTNNNDFFPDMYEGELLRTFCTLYPKITTTLLVCMCMTNRNGDHSITFKLMQTYTALLSHFATSIDKLQTTITFAIPDICQLLDSLEEAAKQNIQNRFTQVGVCNVTSLCEHKSFLQKIYRFRKENNLGHIYSARQIVPTIITMILGDENSPLYTAQQITAGRMPQLIEHGFAWLFSIVDNEEDDNLCRFVVTQCMQHHNSGNIFDITANMTFSDNGVINPRFLETFTDFIYCICAPKWPSSRETVAKLSTTRALEVLMVGIYVYLTKLEKPYTPSCRPQSREQTIFRAMHAVVEIISSVPSTMSTSIVHTSTTTRNPAILERVRERGDYVGDLSINSLYRAQIIRYYEGEFDEKRETYTAQLTTDLQTDCQLVVPESVELIHHHVTVINLHALAIKVKVSAPPTLMAITERLMELVTQTWV